MRWTMRKRESEGVYRDRRLAEGHPDLAKGYLETYPRSLEQHPDDTPRIDRLLTCLDRVVDLRPPKDVLIVGCGPRPQTMRILRDRGYRATGVDPVPTFVRAAEEYLGGSNEVLLGWAEALPMTSSTQDVILCESVLEHVVSPRATIDEMHRVLRPGGIALVITTNRLSLDLFGKNGEFNVPFFNWFPSLLRESYVFRHLHYDPRLANYTTHPAVHWFTFAELCQLGRDCGFDRFYSLLDLFHPDEPFVHGRWWKRFLVRPLQRSTWLRALLLTQVGGAIVMLKSSMASTTSSRPGALGPRAGMMFPRKPSGGTADASDTLRLAGDGDYSKRLYSRDDCPPSPLPLPRTGGEA
jgi:ubiquinone/menaquinone biosynthesis C-methylase UbiE